VLPEAAIDLLAIAILETFDHHKKHVDTSCVEEDAPWKRSPPGNVITGKLALEMLSIFAADFLLKLSGL